MAGGKKKKKPASNPARGFATTSIASKPRADIPDSATSAVTHTKTHDSSANQTGSGTILAASSDVDNSTQAPVHVSPEDFEKQLDESELQSLVDKHSQKSKRDATRQIARLQTDRRLLRSQADALNTRKWLPRELLEEILEVIVADSRSATHSAGHGNISSQKSLSEEDLTIKLWVLQQTLEGAGFPIEKVKLAIDYILVTSDQIVANKDSIWGLEESLEWLARECSRDQLPDYENSHRKLQSLKSQTDSATESVSPSGTNTPQRSTANHDANNDRNLPALSESQKLSSKSTQVKPQAILRYESDSDSDIDPDELLPVYLGIRAQLFHLQPPKLGAAQSTTSRGKRDKQVNQKDNTEKLPTDPEIARLQRKLERIAGDVLFDKYIADQQWEKQRIQLERDAAAHRDATSGKASGRTSDPAEVLEGSDNDEVSKEASRIAAEVLENNDSDNETAVAELFASLPVTEVDSVTGKSNLVVNSSDGTKVTIRDFGKTTGMSPRRVLEEACKARDSSVKISYTLVSNVGFSNRHSIRINWSRTQENLTISSPFPEVDCISSPKSITITMASISTPDASQSESYVATMALFLIFSSSVREEKVYLRLPPAWREFWIELASLKKEQADSADRGAIRALRDIIREKRDREEEDGVVLTTSFKRRVALATPNDTSDESGPEKPGRSSTTSDILKRIWSNKCQSPAYQSMLHSRMQLPMWAFKDEVLRTIDREQVVIICGETGCGKSTQVPSFILEHQLSQGKACKIYCTEPRRISAISLARRVSEELGERKNDLGTFRSLVGYAIRLESNTTKETRLIYATTGIVMRMLEGSNDLKDITHIVLDEVHERTIDSDFLLIILRKLMAKRSDLKVVLMSATVNAERFSKFLDGATVLQVPGRTFPVSSMYLEDAIELTGYSLDSGYQEKKYTDLDDDVDIEDIDNKERTKPGDARNLRAYSARTRNTLAQIDEYQIEYELVQQLMISIATDEQFIKYSKAILVFLPGIAEIRVLNDMLLGHPLFSSNWYIYPLHSTIASEDQEAAFLVPPEGTRKIVLATNIAETGITIPDVTCVIDTGKHREMRFDERRQLSRLLETFISRANAKQRRGRAGRVQEGLCFHLFTKHRHDELMAEQQTPEMLRLSLQDLAIRVKMCKLGGIEETLSQAMDPPLSKNIRRAIDALIDVRALTVTEELTPLGEQLARLPLDVFLGKLILLGSIFKCLDTMITIAAILSSKSPFSAPFGARSQADAVRLGFRRGDSDLLTVYNAYLAWKRVCNTTGADYQFCRKNFLSSQTLSNIEDLKGQLIVSLVDSGFLSLTEAERTSLNRARFSSGRRQFFELPQRTNVNRDNDLVTSSVIAWSFYPKLLARDGKGWRNVANNQSISLHPSSVNKNHNELNWLSYYHIMQAKQFYNAHETTAVTDFAIALLCGDVRCDLYSGVIILDGNRARFAISDWKTMLVIKTLRTNLKDIMTKSFKNPGKSLIEQQMKWLDLWQKIFSQEELLTAKGYGPKV